MTDLLTSGGNYSAAQDSHALRGSPAVVVRASAALLFYLLCVTSLAQEVGRRLWEENVQGAVSAAPAIGMDGTIYVTSAARRLYALDSSGRTKWEFATESVSFSSPVIARDAGILVCAGPIYALSTEGQLVRRFGGDRNLAVAVSADGSTYAAGENALQALATDGTGVWSLTNRAATTLTPAVEADGTILAITNVRSYQLSGFSIYSTNPVLCGASPKGDIRWIDSIVPVGLAAAAIGADGTIYLPSGSLSIFCPFRPFSATNPAAFHLGNSAAVPSPPVIGRWGTVYFGENAERFGPQYFYAMNPDGSLKWKVAIDASVAGAAVDATETIYFGSSKGNFCALDAEGKIRWALDLGSAVGIPALGLNGVLYVGTAAGKVVAVQAAAPPAASSWPQFQRNAQHTGSLETCLSVSRTGGLVLNGIPSRGYRIEYTPGLPSTNWLTLTNLTLSADTQTFTDPAGATDSARFYRAVLLP